MVSWYRGDKRRNIHVWKYVWNQRLYRVSSNQNIDNGILYYFLFLLLFSIYIDSLFSKLKQSGLGCYVGLTLYQPLTKIIE